MKKSNSKKIYLNVDENFLNKPNQFTNHVATEMLIRYAARLNY